MDLTGFCVDRKLTPEGHELIARRRKHSLFAQEFVAFIYSNETNLFFVEVLFILE